MICNVCGKNITDSNATVCMYCNAKLSENNKDQQLAVDAEIVSYGDSRQQDNDASYAVTPEVVDSGNFNDNSKSGYSRFSYASHNAHGVNTLFFESGCFSALITLVLAISCVVQFGVLAAIGFLVFSGIGSMLILLLRVKSMMSNISFNPWFARVATWCLAYLLVLWLSS